MTLAYMIAGLSWDPAIRGILSVGVGVVVLIGSVYVVIGTDVGFKLAALITGAGLFGFLSILTMYWWIQPPGIGPRGGNDPHWVPVEIYVNPTAKDPNQSPLAASNQGQAASPPATDTGSTYPFPYDTPAAQKVSDLDSKLTDEQRRQLPKNYNLSDVKGLADVDPSVAALLPSKGELNNWKIVSTSQGGEAQAATDVALVDAGLFEDSTQYKKLEVYDYGGNPTREDSCPEGEKQNPNSLWPSGADCRVIDRIAKVFRIFHPPHYEIVNVQRVKDQPTKPGEAPPTPQIDPTQPVISVILIRDQGNVRAKPAAFFVICFSLFVFFSLFLHFRDKTAMANRALDPESPAAKYAAARSASTEAEVDKNPDDGGG